MSGTLTIGPDTEKKGIELLDDDPLGMSDPFGISFPPKLKIIEYPGGKHALYCHEGIHGLAVS